MDKKAPPPPNRKPKAEASAQPDPNSALGKATAVYNRVFPPESPQRKFGPFLIAAVVLGLFLLAQCGVSAAGKKVSAVKQAHAEAEHIRTTGVLVVKSNRPEGTVEATLLASPTEPAKGTLGQTLSGLAPGKYAVTVRAEGWPDTRGEVDVTAGQKTEATINFKSGSLRVESVPAGATVRHGKAVLGKTPLVIAQLPPGPAQLSLEYPSWPVVFLKTTITEGTEGTETVRLPHGKLTVESIPAGATVLQGKRTLGQTPLVLEHAPAGAMKLTLQAKDFPPLEASFTVVDGGEVKISQALGNAFPLLDPGDLLAAVWISDEQARSGTTFNATTGIYRPRNDVVKNIHRERLYNGWLRKTYRLSGVIKSYDAASGRVEFAEQKGALSRYRVTAQVKPGSDPGKVIEKDTTLAVYGRLTAVEEAAWPGRVITLEFSDAAFLPDPAP